MTDTERLRLLYQDSEAFKAGIEVGRKEAMGIVKKMREAQKIYAEMFPTGYECYAPTELESEVDELIKEI